MIIHGDGMINDFGSFAFLLRAIGLVGGEQDENYCYNINRNKQEKHEMALRRYTFNTPILAQYRSSHLLLFVA